MRAIEKSKYKAYLRKGDQHRKAGELIFAEGDYDAAITCFTIALINYLDALSVNRFGIDLSSDNHEAAPLALNKRLGGTGVVGFRELARDCVAVLKLKSTASYRAEPLTERHARLARGAVAKARSFVDSNLDPEVDGS